MSFVIDEAIVIIQLDETISLFLKLVWCSLIKSWKFVYTDMIKFPLLDVPTHMNIKINQSVFRFDLWLFFHKGSPHVLILLWSCLRRSTVIDDCAKDRGKEFFTKMHCAP